MASRRRAREYALQVLYDVDLSSAEATSALDDLWGTLVDGEGIDDDVRPAEGEEVTFAQRLVDGVNTSRDEVDALIEQCSTNWRLARMPIVDRNILRIAGFELTQCSDIPATVTINEAVELAKRFGAADSRAFVNGIVDRMARNLNRLPERRARRKRPKRGQS